MCVHKIILGTMAVLFSFLHLVWTIVTLDLPVIRVHIIRIFLVHVFHPCLSHHHCQEHHRHQVNVCIADDFQEHISRLSKPLLVGLVAIVTVKLKLLEHQYLWTLLDASAIATQMMHR